MKSEIEKLCENAGVSEIGCFDSAGKKYKYSLHLPFTAEKQLEIIKFMFHKGIYYDTDGDTYWFHYTDDIENATYRPFEEAIAEFINGFWQDLTEEERKQIKEILSE